MNKEQPLQKYLKESEFNKRIKEMRELGWVIVGYESLTVTKFSKDARFLPEPFQTEEDIKKKYFDKANQEDPSSEYEIDLVLYENIDKLRRLKKTLTDNEYKEILSRLRDADKAFVVLMRKK